MDPEGHAYDNEAYNYSENEDVSKNKHTNLEENTDEPEDNADEPEDNTKTPEEYTTEIDTRSDTYKVDYQRDKTNDEVKNKIVGVVSRSLRETKERKLLRWRKKSFSGYDLDHHRYLDQNRDSRNLKEAAAPELTRSQYSLVSLDDLSPAAVELWHSLPEEVKYDPTLAPFRRYYEKERGRNPSRKTSMIVKKRLPLVNSAPLLNNNMHTQQFERNGDSNKSTQDSEMPKWEEPIPESKPETITKKSKVARAGNYIKLSLLLACWVFFTLVFMMYNEKEEVTRQFSLASDTKDYIINESSPELSVFIKLTGPFLTDQSQKRLNSTVEGAASKVHVWLERWTLGGGGVSNIVGRQVSEAWTAVLDKEVDLDFAVGESRSTVLRLQKTLPVTRSNSSSVLAIRMNTTSEKTVPLSMSYSLDPLDETKGVIYSCVLLAGLYGLIIFEVINRTMAAIIVSTSSLAVLSLVGARPSLPELISWLDAETLLLLFSMMLLVSIMAETGMFDFLAVFCFQVTKGRMWPLISLLCFITAFLSTFLDNVTTVLLMAPVTIRLCEVMELNPVPILMSMVFYSNIGGTATPVGDPPNVIIASNKQVIDSGINFTNFTMHMTLGSLLVCVQTYFQLRFMYRDTNRLRLNVPKEIQELKQQISIWRRAADSLPHLSNDQQVVRERLERKIKKLNVQLDARIRERTKRGCPKDTFQKTLQEMKAKYKIRDKVLLIKSSIAIGFVVAVFFLHSIPELKRVSLGWTALLGALLLLVLADREDLEPILHRVEWSTLLFFAALFVLMEALSKLGLIAYIGGLTEGLILSVPESSRLAVSLLLMLWVSGLTSAFVDNIPLTTMMVRIVTSLGSNPALGLPMAPLIWALSFGACMGGNGTLIGASANVVCVGVAEQHGYRISFVEFFKTGFPLMLGHLTVISAYLLLFHCVIVWH